MPGEIIGSITLDKVYGEIDRRLGNLERRTLGFDRSPNFLPDGSLFAPQGVRFGDGTTGFTINTTAPPQPTNLVLTVGANENRVFLDVAWTVPGNVSNIDGYFVELTTGAAPSITAYVVNNGTRFEPLEPFTTYTVSVKSIGKNGSYSAALTGNISTGRDTTVPGQVTGLSLTPAFRSIQASWNAVTDGDVNYGRGEYEVTLALDSGFASVVRTNRVGGTLSAFTDLTSGVQYWVRVRALDNSGNYGPYSAAATATTVRTQTADYQALSIVNATIGDLQVDNAKISTLDAAKINTGFLAAARIDAQTITANKLNVISGGDNRAKNSSFQANSQGGFADDWINYNQPGTDTAATISRVVDGVYGDIALRLTWTTNNGNKGIYQAVPVGSDLSPNGWQANGVWIVSIYVKGNKVPQPVFDQAGFTISPISIPAVSTSIWQRYVYKITTTNALNSNLYWAFTGSNGDVYIDATQVEFGDVPSGWAPRTNEILPGTINATMLVADLAIINTIRSQNPSTGWSIAGDGTVVFNNGTFRGTINALGGSFSGNISSSAVISGGSFRTANEDVIIDGGGVIIKAPVGNSQGSKSIRFLRDDLAVEFTRIWSQYAFGGATAGLFNIDAAYGGGNMRIKANQLYLVDINSKTIATIYTNVFKINGYFETSSGAANGYRLYGDSFSDIAVNLNKLYLADNGNDNHYIQYEGGQDAPVMRGHSNPAMYSVVAAATATMQGDGNFVVYNARGAYNLTSSIEFKTAVTDYPTGALEKVRLMRPVTFKRTYTNPSIAETAKRDAFVAAGTDQPYYTEKLARLNQNITDMNVNYNKYFALAAQNPEVGFIAEELLTVDSNLVFSTDISPKAIFPLGVLAVLVKAFKELDVQVQTIQARLPAV